MEYFKYVPEWNENREKSKENRVVVEVNCLTRRDVMRYAKMIKRKQKKGFRVSAENVEDNGCEVQETQFIENIGTITNLHDILTNEPITDGATLHDARGYSDLCAEILNAMEEGSALLEGAEKNFEPQSDGRSTKGSGATVKTA